jgi:gliding motility-associated-like protein
MKIIKSRFYLIVIFSQLFFVSAFGISAKFTYVKRSNCAPTVVEFINSSTTGAGITYTWDFGLGAVISESDNSNKIQVYTKPGQYKVTLTVDDGTNTVVTNTIITIAQGPKANFTASPTIGCDPLLVNFTSTSGPGDSAIVSTSWDFRNGDYGTGASISHTYYNTGKYNVLLKVTDKIGCYSIIESDSLINVINKPVVNFTATDTFACNPPLNATFINLSSGATDLTYRWDYGNGQTSTELSSSSVYTAKGSYDVKLKATDQYGCSDSLTKKSYIKIGNQVGTMEVYDSNHNIVNKSSLCSGTYTFVFSINNLPDYTWIIDDNKKINTFSGKNSITYLVTDTGTLDVNLVYGKDSYCTENFHKIYKKSYIQAAFTADTSLFCSLPQMINLKNNSKNADSSYWYIYENNFSKNANPSYTITQNDLPAETYKQLYSHEINTTHIPITVVITNSAGCSDSITKIVTLSKPVARFMPDTVSGCLPLLVSFSDSSKSVFKIDTYKYKIDGNTFTNSDKTPVNYTFTKAGEYYISEIISSAGCTDTSHMVKIVVGDKLIPDFTITPSEVCNGGKIHIVGNSNNNSVVDSWHLSSPNIFSYSSNSRPDTSLAVYSDTTGYKNITLQVNYNGCFSDITKSAIYKINGPAGNFSSRFTCDSALVYHFKSKISPATSFIWNIDTAVVKNVDSVRYKFPVSGDFTVKLLATDTISHCSLSRTKLIKVRQVNAAFTLNDSIFCVGDTAKLNASTSKDYINSCYNEGFLWNFGDNSQPRRTFSTTWNHIYNSKGTFTLSLLTKADNGCIDSAKKIVHVYKPSGTFTTDKKSGCLPSLNVNFTNTSTDTTIVSWVWNFADGITDSTQSKKVSHTYITNAQQTYNSALTVYDAYQCYSNYSIPITLIGINGDFQADDNAICAGQKVTFMPIGKCLDSLKWDFGDGNSSVTSEHIYNNRGSYSVSLIASKSGCRDTITKTNYISVEKADATFSISDSVFNCYPDTLYFVHTNKNGSPVIDRIWTFNSRELTDKSDSVKYIYSRPGTYTTKLDVKTLNGCQASNSKSIKITGPIAYISFSPKTICYEDYVKFQIDSSSNISSWKWLFGDGNSSLNNPVSHQYTSRGNIIPSILLINKDCSVTQTLDTLHISKIKADFTSTNDTSKICSGTKLDFTNHSTYSDQWTWKVNNVIRTNDFHYNDVIFSQSGENNVTLIAMDSNNCTDTMIRKYTVVSNPVFSITGDSIMCYGQESIDLSVNKETGWTIKWTPATGLSSSSSFTTTARPTNKITYTAKVSDSYGCSSTKQKTIVINQPFNYSRIPVGDTTIYIGQTIPLTLLTDLTDLKYSWSPYYNISCINCSNPNVSPTKDVTYQVEIKNGCIDFVESFNIKVILDFYLEAPSAFTPNGDTYNDIFKFETKDIKNFELKIFDRWGKMVFSTNDILQGWDGKVNGYMQNIDTYIYYVKAESIYGYKFEKKGSFLLLK